MVVMAEARGTPSYVSPAMQSPRYRGCVCTFFSLIGWTSEKRFSSTRRLPASKLGKGSFRRSRSFRTDRGKSRTRHDDTAVVATTRPPGVVARLMGLDSLPEASYPPLGHCRSLPDHSRSTPVLLQDFLKQDVKPSKTTKSLRERLFSKRASHGQYGTRKGTFAAFRCRSEGWCISPTLVDIPQAQSRLMYAVTQKQNPFLSRRPPSSANVHGEAIPELSLLHASSTGRDIVLQGWPLAGQHNVPRDLYDSDLQQESTESVGSRPTDSASSKPLLPHSKVVQGRRRSSSWHGSDDSESTINGPAGPRRRLAPPSERHQRSLHSRSPAAPRHPIRRSKPVTSPGPEFTATRRRGSKSPTFKAPSTDRQPLIIPLENHTTSVSHASPCTSQSSVTGELRLLSSQSPSAGQSRGSRAGRQSAKSVSSPMKNVSLAERVGKTTMTKSKNTIRLPDLAPGKPPPDRAVKARQPKGKGSPSPESQTDVSRHRSSLLSHGELWNGRKKGDSKRTSPKLQRLTETVVSRHKGIQKVRQIHTPCQTEVQDVGDRLKSGNPNAEDMASQHSSKSDELVLRKQSQAEDVASYALDCKSLEADARLLHRPVERALFSPDFDFSECTNHGAPMEISMSPLIDYDELCDSGEYDKDCGGISSSPLIDCDGLGGASMHVGAVTTAENESISMESYPVGEIRWEDEIVETILSGRCCERSCSGPSVSSRSATLSDEERNGDSWSSCASFNSGDCDSPSDALSESPQTNFQAKDLEVEVEVLHQEPKSPPPQLVQKTLDESFVDEIAGHPSPVSVLQSPFHDETCTTSESSPESKPQLSDEEEIINEEIQREPPTSNIDRIKQALLDISMFRIHDADCSAADHPPVPREQPKDEQRFIREVLAAAKFLSTTPPNWYSPECPMDPSLFDRLESEGVVLACGGLWRCDRKLLFDCVNEAFGLISSRRWHLQWSPEPLWQCPELVVAVVKNIHEWRTLASFAIDSLIERDMSVAPGNWICVAPDVAAVGVEIESMVWTGILDEVAVDIVECVTRKNGTALDHCLQSCVSPIECPDPVDPAENQPSPPNPPNPANPANHANHANHVNPPRPLSL